MRLELQKLAYEVSSSPAFRELLGRVVDLEVAGLTDQLVSAARDGKKVEAARLAGAIGALQGFIGLLEAEAKQYQPDRG